MEVRYKTDDKTGRVTSLKLLPSGAGDEMFLGALAYSIATGEEIEVTGLNGNRFIFEPGVYDEDSDTNPQTD